MSAAVVVDSSVALKWVLNERDSTRAVALLADWTARAVTLHVPTLLAYEVGNVLYQHLRRDLMTLESARDALAAILMPEFQFDLSDERGLTRRAMELAHQFNLPAAYDAHYLALAERHRCDLWTADERLWNTVKMQLPWVRWLGEHAAGAVPGQQS